MVPRRYQTPSRESNFGSGDAEGRERSAARYRGQSVDGVRVNASAVRLAPQTTQPRSTSASLIAVFTARDSSHAGQRNTYPTTSR